MLNGDTDLATDLLVRLQVARGTATLDEDAIAMKAAAAARAQLIREQEEVLRSSFEKERIEASNSFPDDYPDIVEDPQLFKMANAKTLEIYQDHPDWRPKAIFDEAVRSVRTWIAGRSVQMPASDKLDAKRSQTTIRSGTAKAAARPAPKPMTNSQYVENLRRSRGLDV
jgi:hypothetical protein